MMGRSQSRRRNSCSVLVSMESISCRNRQDANWKEDTKDTNRPLSPLLTLMASRLLSTLCFYFVNSIFYWPFSNLNKTHFVMRAAYTIACLVSYLAWALLEGGHHYLPIFWAHYAYDDGSAWGPQMVKWMRIWLRLEWEVHSEWACWPHLFFFRDTCVLAMKSWCCVFDMLCGFVMKLK